MANRKIIYDIDFKASTTALNNIKSELQQLKQLTTEQLIEIKPELQLWQAKEEIDKLKSSIAEIEIAFNKSFNTNLGITNITTLKRELQSLELKKIASDFSSIGSKGIQA